MLQYKNIYIALIFLVMISGHCAVAQSVGTYLGNERFMFAETKQVNQFFRRFNSEEDLAGKRIDATSKEYQNPEFRRKYIAMLFDNETGKVEKALKDEFIQEVTVPGSQKLLNFYENEWFAEVKASFYYKGKLETVILFLSLEQENLGHKWVITNVHFKPFADLFYTETTSSGSKFMHPMSHEIDFMNLIKVFKDGKNLEYYFDNNFKPDFRTIFLYEVKKGDLIFDSVEDVSFHFFQVDNWYFELTEFNRNTPNSGWLVSNLTKIPENQKELLLKYIYYEK
ncbi:MAG: hypothetical protein ACFCUU_02905 [Cyclobacteriaceae bacterium]